MNQIESKISEILLDHMKDNKQILRNKAFVKEKLYQLLLNCLTLFTFLVIQFVYFIEFSEEIISKNHACIVNLTIIITIILIWRTYRILHHLKKNKSSDIKYDLMFVQLLVASANTLHVLILIQSIIQSEDNELKLNISSAVYQDSMKYIFFVTNIIVGAFLTNVIISNLLKCYIQFIYEVVLILYSIKQYNSQSTTDLIIQITILHVILLLSMIQSIIQQNVMVVTFQEQNERMELSFQTMHDLRNYVQSYIELMNNITSINDPIQEHKTKSKIKACYSVTSQDVKNSYNGKVLNYKLIEEDERKEILMQQKFIIYKICQIQHLELMFQNDQNIQSKQIDVKELIHEGCEILKTLFQNKSNSIMLEYKSYLEIVEFDKTIFFQILSDISKLLHDMGHDNIHFQILLITQENCIELMLWTQAANFNYNSWTMLRDRQTLNRLFQYLNPDSSFKIQNQGDRVRWNVIIPTQYTWEEEEEHSVNLGGEKVEGKVINNLINYRNEKERSVQGSSQRSAHKGFKKIKLRNKINNNNTHVNGKEYSNSVSRNLSRNQSVDYSNISRNESLKQLDQTHLSKLNSSNSSMVSNKIIQNETIIVKSNNNNNDNILINIEDKDLIKKENDQQQNDQSNENTNENNEETTNISNKNTINNKDITSMHIHVHEENATEDIEISKEPTKEFKDTNAIIEHIKQNSLKLSKKSSNKTSSMKSNKPENSIVMALFQNLNPVTYHEKDSLILINVDDEENILKMNKRIIGKEGYTLNCVKNSQEFLNLLTQVQKKITESNGDQNPAILVLMDHMLDREQGHQCVQYGKDLNLMLKMDVTQVLVSSTEDKETLDKQHKVGVSQTIVKPLNKSKFSPVFESFKNEKVQLKVFSVEQE